MAAPAYATDLVDIFTDGTTTGWTAIGGGASGLNQETDYFIQNTSCLSKNAWASATKGMIYSGGAITVTAGDAIFIWMTHQTANSLDLEANGGLRVLIGSGSGDYYEYYVSGSDIIVYDDRWVCFVIDPRTGTVAADVTTGTPTATISFFGGLAKMVGGPTKGAPFGIDAIRYGRAFTYTLGDLGNGYATFDGGATYNDAIARALGQIQLSGGQYKVQGLQELGITATAVDFRDSDRDMVIARTTKVSGTFNGFEVNHASSRVDWTRINIKSLNTVSRGYFKMNDNATVNKDTCVFTDMSTFEYLSNATLTKVTYRRDELVTQGGATFDACIFDSTTVASALSVDVLGLVTDCSFISDGSSYAVDLGTISTTQSLDWKNFVSGYAVADGATGNEVITVSVASGQTLTINVATGYDTPTIHNTGLGTVTVVASVTVTVTAVDSDQNPVEGASVYLKTSGGTVVLNGVTNASGVLTGSYSGTTPATLDTTVSAVRSSSTAIPYQDFTLGGTIDATGYSQTAILSED